GSMPRMRSVPPLGGDTQPIIRIVELLPAPFGPRNPNASPRATSKSIPSTAVNPPKRLVSPRATMYGPSGYGVWVTLGTVPSGTDRTPGILTEPGGSGGRRGGVGAG